MLKSKGFLPFILSDVLYFYHANNFLNANNCWYFNIYKKLMNAKMLEKYLAYYYYYCYFMLSWVEHDKNFITLKTDYTYESAHLILVFIACLKEASFRRPLWRI